MEVEALHNYGKKLHDSHFMQADNKNGRVKYIS